MNHAYINWNNFPPRFYCNKYTNTKHPPENDKGWYCTKQCFDCMAEVGEQRRKTEELIKKQQENGNKIG